MRFLFEYIGYKITGQKIEIDKNVPVGYFLKNYFALGIMALRGVFYFGFKHGLIYVGRKVKIRCKSFLLLGGGGTRIYSGVTIDALSKNGIKLGTHCAVGRHTYIHCGREGAGMGLGKGLVAGNNVQIGAFSHFNCSG
jgi:acetyltransferase-like isoleucine patch superfamily enzyme